MAEAAHSKPLLVTSSPASTPLCLNKAFKSKRILDFALLERESLKAPCEKLPNQICNAPCTFLLMALALAAHSIKFWREEETSRLLSVSLR